MNQLKAWGGFSSKVHETQTLVTCQWCQCLHLTLPKTPAVMNRVHHSESVALNARVSETPCAYTMEAEQQVISCVPTQLMESDYTHSNLLCSFHVSRSPHMLCRGRIWRNFLFGEHESFRQQPCASEGLELSETEF
jgi:hypothetical protein